MPQTKEGLSTDLKKLLSKRQEVERLQGTLMGILTNSGGKKTVNVEDLKRRLATETGKENKFKLELTDLYKQ